jgi:photosystem II stability/assembly factor-like uncharacterized protein
MKMNLVNVLLFLVLMMALQNCVIVNKTGYDAYQNKNESIVYTDSICYSRAIKIYDKSIYSSNSNGKIYQHKFKSKKNSELTDTIKSEELRDISINNGYVYGMQSGSTGKLIEISPKNKIRIIVYDFWKGVFLDGMDFYGSTGFMLGDPVNNNFSLFHSKDGGKSWNICEGLLPALKGEAGYAASGTNVQVLNDSTYCFISGGSINRFYKSTDAGKNWTSTVVPFNTGEGIGAFSICFKNNLEGIAVGGDYQKPLLIEKTIFKTVDGGLNWEEMKNGTRGFRSCAFFKNDIYYICGTNGIDYSRDGGVTWFNLINGNFFSMTSDDDFLYATSPKSTILKIKLIK